MTRRALALSAAVLLAILTLAAPAQADTKVASFDDLIAGTSVSNQYQGSHGLYFRGPATGDGWFPVVRSAPGVAHSGSQIADISTCTASNCEGFQPRSIGRLTTTASTIGLYVGFTGTDPPPQPTTEITLTALDSGGGTIGSQSATVTQGQPFTQLLSVSAPGGAATIAAFQLSAPSGAAGGVAMDDITITRPDPAPGAPPPAPDFSVTVPADPVNVPEGDAVDVPVSITRINGSDGDIALSASGLPSGVSATFAPNPVAGTATQATMTLTAAPGATATDYTEITVRATPAPGAGSAERTATKLIRVVGNCVRIFRTDFIDVRSTDCMRTLGTDRLVATKPVRFNGLLLEPQDAGRLVIDKVGRNVTSEGRNVRVSPADHTSIKISEDPIDWHLGGGENPKQVIDSASSLQLNAGGEEPLVDLFVFFRVERMQVLLTRSGKAQVLPTLKFGFWPFNYFGSGTTTSTTTGFSTDNDSGSTFDALGFKLDKITALGVELKDVSFLYQAGGTLSGGATLVLRLAKPYEVSAGFGLKRGDFDFLRASVSGLNQPVSTGVFLQRIGLEVQRHPLSILGSALFSAGPELHGARFVDVTGTIKVTLDDPLVIELNGTANLLEKYLGNRFQLGKAFVRYTSTGLFEFGGSHDWDLKVAYIKGNVSGFVDGLNAASIEGSEKLCIPVPFFSDPCGGAALIASTIGVAACANVIVGDVGVGYAWGGSFDLWWGSCDLSPWRPVPGGARAAAGGGKSFKLRPGLRSAAFAVEGDAGPPDVTLTGPRGEKLSLSSAKPQAKSGSLSGIQVESGTTYLLAKKPSAGTWTLQHDGGSAIKQIKQAFGIPPASVRGRVAGKARARTLSWTLRPIAGQRVRFIETGRDVHNQITVTRAARGRVRFTPAPGPAGKRGVVAYVEQNGLARKRITVASYRAPNTLRPSRPRGARIVRRGSNIVVSWRAPVAGFRHAVAFRLGDGRELAAVVPAGKRSVTIPGLARGYGATASIMGLTHANGKGPAVKVKLPADAPSPAVGRWRLASVSGALAKGRFDVRRRALTGLRMTPGPNAAPACGTAELRVAGGRTLTRSTKAGLAIWIAGKRAVRVTRGGKRLNGTLAVSFPDPRHGTGELNVAGGCRLYFEAGR
jgi:hypothetical protein